MFPTYEHQRKELIKNRYHKNLDRSDIQSKPENLVTLSYWSTVTDTFEVRDENTLHKLSRHHIWTSNYASKRLHWRPKHALTVLLLRVFKLHDPVTLPILDKYAGCKSWVNLNQEAELKNPIPVLDENAYQQKSDPIKKILV